MAVENKKKWWEIRKTAVEEEEEQEKSLTIHVRRNGSRYVDPDEFFSTPGIQKVVEDLKDFQPDKSSTA